MRSVLQPRVWPWPAQPAPFWWGLAAVAAVAALAMALAQTAWAQGAGLSALILAILLGIGFGNSLFPPVVRHTAAGVDFSKSTLLRLGIVLYGFRITFQQIAEVGVAGLVIDMAVVAAIFGLAVGLGTRVFKLDRETSMLIGAGSAICGAAAVMAAEPVLRAQAHKVSVAVATVVVFGTVGMFLYPVLYPYLGFSEHAYGVFAGSTIHEVAQVVVAGKAIGETAAAAAVIEKMLRVMLLAPFLLLLSSHLRRTALDADTRTNAVAKICIPWFAVLFIAVSAFNSLQLLPQAWVACIVQADTVLLAMAMAALGLRTQVSAIRQAGAKPLLLAAVLFCVLVGGGWALNAGVDALL